MYDIIESLNEKIKDNNETLAQDIKELEHKLENDIKSATMRKNKNLESLVMLNKEKNKVLNDELQKKLEEIRLLSTSVYESVVFVLKEDAENQTLMKQDGKRCCLI